MNAVVAASFDPDSPRPASRTGKHRWFTAPNRLDGRLDQLHKDLDEIREMVFFLRALGACSELLPDDARMLAFAALGSYAREDVLAAGRTAWRTLTGKGAVVTPVEETGVPLMRAAINSLHAVTAMPSIPSRMSAAEVLPPPDKQHFECGTLIHGAVPGQRYRLYFKAQAVRYLLIQEAGGEEAHCHPPRRHLWVRPPVCGGYIAGRILGSGLRKALSLTVLLESGGLYRTEINTHC